jgi:signal transduction histidine kinase
LKTFIPFRQVKESGEEGEAIMGVIEIVKDLSRDYTAILKLQSRIIMVSSVVMTILFLVLRTIVWRAGKIIEKRTVERLKLEEQLNRTERLAQLGTMVATVSHEIKSPLGIVRSTADILKKRITKLAPGNENLAQIIIDETTRLNTIVTEFLDFARPQEPKLQPHDLNQIVRRAIGFIRPLAEEKAITISEDLGSEPIYKQVDEDMIYRVFLNILINAIQATADDGTVRVSVTRSEDGRAIVRIADTGSGMSEEMVEQIFQPFFTDKRKGTGLGLAIAHNSIERHHGEILVDSSEGVGSTFTIILP